MKKLTAIILAVCLVCLIVEPSTKAMADNLVMLETFVDGKSSGVKCLLLEGEAYITTSDLPTLFPEEPENTFGNENEFSKLALWADRLGYMITINENQVNLYKMLPVKIFVNGCLLEDVKAYRWAGMPVMLLDSYSELRYIFPAETADLEFPNQIGYISSLKMWTEEFNYSYSEDNDRVFVSKKNDTITVVVNDRLVEFPDQQPIIKDGRTLVPVRFVAQELGYTVTWDAELKAVSISDEEKKILLFIGVKQAIVQGQIVALDVTPEILNGRTMVPIRFVAENFGYQVSWVSNSTTFGKSIVLEK